MIRSAVLVAVFLSGACLMSLEMLSFRLLSPQFGSDITVTGAMISVFLAGLAIGAFLGGKLADLRPAAWKLALILGGAGLIAAATPLYSGAVLDWTFPAEGGYSQASAEDFGGLDVYLPAEADLRTGTLAAGVILFFPPALLLGTISPYAAKLLIHRLGRLGAGVGRISALSTIGAILGTLLTSFYLITLLGTAWLLAANGLVLIGLGAMVLVAARIARRAVPEPVGASEPGA